MQTTLRKVYSAERDIRSPLSSFGGSVPSMRHSGYNFCSLVYVIPAKDGGLFFPFLQFGQKI